MRPIKRLLFGRERWQQLQARIRVLADDERSMLLRVCSGTPVIVLDELSPMSALIEYEDGAIEKLA